ncbi:MAG TPA: hypothetical protein VFC23_20565 [Thermoanaerobaculia bacterium]|nr:hypothetical protein [Thermoanaerobaculia bacterium]
MAEAQVPGEQDQIADPGNLEDLAIGCAPKTEIPDILDLETGGMKARRQRAGQILVDQESLH